MTKYSLSGLVHPERVQLSIDNLTQTIVASEDSHLKLVFNICLNRISAILESPTELPFEDVRNYVKASVMQTVSVISFLKGYGYDVEISKVHTDELDAYRVFGIDIPVVENLFSDLNINTAFRQILPLLSGGKGIFLQRCLTDLNLALRYLDDTPFYCYRALESLKQSFAWSLNLDPKDDKLHWIKMAEAIGGHKSETEPVFSLAFPARHGMPARLTDEKRADIFKRTWLIVERYVNFRLSQIKSDFRLHHI